MKKILFAALAALAITSCSQNEIDGIDNGTPKSKNEIGVNTIVKKSSRAAVTSNSSFTSFKLHAYIVKSNDIATSGWGNAYMDGIENIKEVKVAGQQQVVLFTGLSQKCNFLGIPMM